MAEQRYQAVLSVVSDGLSISQVASKVGVSRQTVHAWLARYEAEGLEGFAVFEDVVRLTAQALGIELDDVRCVSEFAQTTSDLDLG